LCVDLLFEICVFYRLTCVHFGNIGDGGQASYAALSEPIALGILAEFDPVRKTMRKLLYISDAGNNDIRRITLTNLAGDPIAGQPTPMPSEVIEIMTGLFMINNSAYTSRPRFEQSPTSRPTAIPSQVRTADGEIHAIQDPLKLMRSFLMYVYTLLYLHLPPL
jgi:hypothetical protein